MGFCHLYVLVFDFVIIWMQTAYFDYLGSVINIVPQTIPRIDAWTDDFVDQYMVLYPKFKKMEVML